MEELGCYMKKNNLFKRLLPVGALLAFASLANATLVGPGQTVAATPDGALPPPANQVATISGTLVNVATNLDATYTETVYTDGGVACPACLDFVIKVTNLAAGKDDIVSVTGSNFGNAVVTTDVGYIAPTVPPPNTDAPMSINRDSVGDVQFSFANLPGGTGKGEIPPGDSSYQLIIRTNALAFETGNVSVQDGSTVTAAGFGVAPEPNMAALLSVFAAGIIGIAYRRKKNAAKNTEA
jgi:hypothetical protein